MVRGFAWGLYTDDDGVDWSMRLDADYFADPDRCWSTLPDPPPAQFPRLRKARRVMGIDAEGRTATCVVPRLDCPLWTGEQSVFLFNGTDQLPHTATIIRHFGEWRGGTPA